jgi:L-seryl-tRNA(Ser) seleniumtransferase
MIAMSLSEIRQRAEAWQGEARARGLQVGLVDGESTVGGGSLPGEVLPTMLLELPLSITAASLRSASVPVIARTGSGRVLLDLRTVPREHEHDLLRSVVEASGDADSPARQGGAR